MLNLRTEISTKYFTKKKIKTIQISRFDIRNINENKNFTILKAIQKITVQILVF